MLVDKAAAPLLERRRWYRLPSGYARSPAKKGTEAAYAHRVVSSAPRGFSVDHINGDKLDNRLANLRVTSQSLNNANQVKRAVAASRYRGVSRGQSGSGWRARIILNGVEGHLGTYATEEEAASAWDDAARRAYGSFARVNFPLPGEQPALVGRTG